MESVHALWIGEAELKPLEILTIRSFLRYGAEFNLWTYKPVGNLPYGVKVRDGNEILSKDKFFRYPNTMFLPHTNTPTNSLVGFSELFRFKVMYECGGWYSDMDVTCLRPLSEHNTDYYFRFHGILPAVTNILKAPAKSELMKLCYEKVEKEINETQRDWHRAISIFCYYVEFLDLRHYIQYDRSNLDLPGHVYPLFTDRQGHLDEIPKEWDFIHWMNSLTPQPQPDSVLDLLLKKYSCFNVRTQMML